uniref:Regulator of microtubule dynamics protein 1-like n=1 Tax=Hirondellea gigas TaxID=1518452 RepID=A0A6A7G4G1_9CRUS
MVRASGLTELLRRVDCQFSSGLEGDIEQAHATLLEAEKTFQENAELLWRLAKSYRNLASLEEKKGNTDLKRSYIFEAYVFAERALTVNDSSPDTHKWFAILSGARGEYLGTKERIASGREFKKHIDAALSYSPNDATLHHLLGRFCYEISGLTWLERKAAAALFGAVPDSSYVEALDHFKAAERLHIRGWKENRLFLAKCHIKLGELPEVPAWLSEGLLLPSATADDMVVHKELQLLAQKYPL